MNCYLSRNYKGADSAGNKAKMDIEKIMDRLSFRNVGLRQTTYSGKVSSFFATLGSVLKAPFCLAKGDCLVIQYPLKKYFTFVCRTAHLRGTKVIVVIHDLGSFRRKRLTVEQEINRLSYADYIIVHNQKMKKWLEDNGCKVQLGVLGIFDYLSETKAIPKNDFRKPFTVLYAGGLDIRKNAFLYEIGDHIHSSYKFNLYGNGFQIDKAKGNEYLNYMGFVKSDDLIKTAKGDWGLVWDGLSVSSCIGNFGEYLRYNNPHKTSLYIRCELPIIIWSEAALAGFVNDNKIGICVDSLEDLERKLAELTIDDYKKMKENVCCISERLSRGYYFEKAVNEAIENIKGD